MFGKNKERIFRHIIEEHVNEAAFLWTLRDRAVTQAHQTPASLRKLETRLIKHLKGCLAVSPDIAWEYALEMAEFVDGGETFVLTTLAFTHGDRQKIKAVLDMADRSEPALRSIVSALAWLPDRLVFPWLRPWMQSTDALYSYLSVAVCSLRRINPKDHLQALLRKPDTDPRLLGRLLRLAGELKRHDLRQIVTHFISHDDADARFWACWSALMLGESKAIPFILDYTKTPGPLQLAAIACAIRRMESSEAWNCINSLVQAQEDMHPAILALAALGDTHGISWLLARMNEREYAQAAGEAFSLVTGIEITDELAIPPEAARTDHDDSDEDGIPTLDDYISLPVPDANKVAERWHKMRQHFRADQRYFLGQVVTEDHVKPVLLSGRQSQRQWAAHELAMLQPNTPLPNIKAPQESLQ